MTDRELEMALELSALYADVAAKVKPSPDWTDVQRAFQAGWYSRSKTALREIPCDEENSLASHQDGNSQRPLAHTQPPLTASTSQAATTSRYRPKMSQ